MQLGQSAMFSALPGLPYEVEASKSRNSAFAWYRRKYPNVIMFICSGLLFLILCVVAYRLWLTNSNIWGGKILILSSGGSSSIRHNQQPWDARKWRNQINTIFFR